MAVVQPRMKVAKVDFNGSAKDFAKIVKYGKIVGFAGLVLSDAAEVGDSIKRDYALGTSRNTTETFVSVVGRWFGNFGGAAGGAALGKRITSGVGIILFSFIGGVGGGFIGLKVARVAAETIGDTADYDMEQRVCKKCIRKFKVRKYKKEENSICEECANATR